LTGTINYIHEDVGMSVDRVQGLRKIVNQAEKSSPPSPWHAVCTLTLNIQDSASP